MRRPSRSQAAALKIDAVRSTPDSRSAGRCRARLREPRQRLLDAAAESAVEKQVFRRVAAEREFRASRSAAAPARRASSSRCGDAPGVALHVADGGIDLCERDAHAGSAPALAATATRGPSSSRCRARPASARSRRRLPRAPRTCPRPCPCRPRSRRRRGPCACRRAPSRPRCRRRRASSRAGGCTPRHASSSVPPISPTMMMPAVVLVALEQREHLDEVQAAHRVAADADAGRLAEAARWWSGRPPRRSACPSAR